jgi:hypothetical protein
MFHGLQGLLLYSARRRTTMDRRGAGRAGGPTGWGVHCRRTDRRAGGRAGGPTGKRMSKVEGGRLADGRTGELADGRTGRRTADRQADGWLMNGRAGGRADRLLGRWAE